MTHKQDLLLVPHIDALEVFSAGNTGEQGKAEVTHLLEECELFTGGSPLHHYPCLQQHHLDRENSVDALN